MIAIARHTDYAARLVLHLASLEEGARVSIAEVARQRRLPVAFVRRILAPLVRAGIIATVRGAGGGIRLGRPAARISLLDIVRVMEGGVVLNACVHDVGACPFARKCPVRRAWTDVTGALERSLAGVRFDALARAPGHAVAHRRLAGEPGSRARRHKTRSTKGGVSWTS